MVLPMKENAAAPALALPAEEPEGVGLAANCVDIRVKPSVPLYHSTEPVLTQSPQ